MHTTQRARELGRYLHSTGKTKVDFRTIESYVTPSQLRQLEDARALAHKLNAFEGLSWIPLEFRLRQRELFDQGVSVQPIGLFLRTCKLRILGVPFRIFFSLSEESGNNGGGTYFSAVPPNKDLEFVALNLLGLFLIIEGSLSNCPHEFLEKLAASGAVDPQRATITLYNYVFSAGGQVDLHGYVTNTLKYRMLCSLINQSPGEDISRVYLKVMNKILSTTAIHEATHILMHSRGQSKGIPTELFEEFAYLSSLAYGDPTAVFFQLPCLPYEMKGPHHSAGVNIVAEIKKRLGVNDGDLSSFVPYLALEPEHLSLISREILETRLRDLPGYDDDSLFLSTLSQLNRFNFFTIDDLPVLEAIRHSVI